MEFEWNSRLALWFVRGFGPSCFHSSLFRRSRICPVRQFSFQVVFGRFMSVIESHPCTKSVLSQSSPVQVQSQPRQQVALFGLSFVRAVCPSVLLRGLICLSVVRVVWPSSGFIERYFVHEFRVFRAFLACAISSPRFLIPRRLLRVPNPNTNTNPSQRSLSSQFASGSSSSIGSSVPLDTVSGGARSKDFGHREWWVCRKDCQFAVPPYSQIW